MQKFLLSSILPAALLSLGAVSAHAQAVTGQTASDFDSTNNTNSVDGISSNVPGQTIASWEATVEAAAASTTGVIWNSGVTTNPASPATPVAFSDDAGQGATDTAFNNVTLGFASGTKSLALASSVNMVNAAFGSASPISGSPNGRASSSSAQSSTAYSFTFALSGAGLLALERVTEFGLVYLARSGGSGAGDLTIQGFLNSGSSISLGNPTAFGALASQGTEDTLFHFRAPAGDYFTGFSYASTTNRENPFDDFGAVTTQVVPEPTALGLLGVAGVALVSRRRRA